MSKTVPVTVYYQSNQSTGNQSKNFRNQPQSNALSTGFCLFVTGGMNLALGLGWNLNSSIPTTEHYQFCWFIGVIVGALVAPPLIKMLHKKFFMGFSTLLVIIAGIIFTSAPYNYNAIIAARYLNGIAIGFATIPYLVHAGEIAAKTYRGTCASLEQYGISIGLTIQVIYSNQWTYYIDFSANRLHGIISIVLGLLAFSSIYWTIDSPIFYLRKHDDGAALESLCRLRRPQVITDARKALLEVQKSYVYESEHHGLVGSFMRGLMPLIKMILYRSMLALSFSLPLSIALRTASLVSMGYTDSWPPIVFAALRFFGSFLTMFLLDGLGRKLLSMFSLLVMAGFTIGIGVIFSDTGNIVDTYEMSVVCTLALLFQFFAGMFTPSSSAYLSEAFPLVAKPYMIALCVGVEQAVHIIVICTFNFSMHNEYAYNIAAGVIMFAMFLLFSVTIPETRNTTLREAEHRFKRLLHFKCF